jgi:hypothetical protein
MLEFPEIQVQRQVMMTTRLVGDVADDQLSEKPPADRKRAHFQAVSHIQLATCLWQPVCRLE